MKKTALITALIIMLTLPSLALAGGSSSNKCDTRYPVVLAHGMGVTAKIFGIVDCWWGIEGPLEDEGADVYITSVDAMNSSEIKARQFENQVLEILAVTGASRVNVIGHSHGGVYSRYAISNGGLGNKVASLTTISSPHRGSKIADIVIEDMPDGLTYDLCGVLDVFYKLIFQERSVSAYTNTLELTRSYMRDTFNPNTPNVSGVYYQSWTGKAKWSCPSIVLEPTWAILLYFEGANDGMVSVNSAKWGNFRGVEDAAWWSPGVDHMNIVGHLFGITPGFDAGDFYVDIVANLEDRGF